MINLIILQNLKNLQKMNLIILNLNIKFWIIFSNNYQHCRMIINKKQIYIFSKNIKKSVISYMGEKLNQN